MPRLSAVPGLCGGVLVLAAAVWWLSSLGLLARADFAGTGALSADLAGIVVLGQWLLAGLLAASSPGSDATLTERLAAVAFLIAPAWPLLVLLWLASGISAVALGLSQLGVLGLGAVMAILGGAIARLPLPAALRSRLAVALGLLVAAAIWLGRVQLDAWVCA